MRGDPVRARERRRARNADRFARGICRDGCGRRALAGYVRCATCHDDNLARNRAPGAEPRSTKKRRAAGVKS